MKVVHEIVNDRWEVAVTMSEKGFQQASFVNSIATTKVGFLKMSVLKHSFCKISVFIAFSICLTCLLQLFIKESRHSNESKLK